MPASIETIQEYFNAPKDYFWRWAEKGNVVEWSNGTTICFRDELILAGKAIGPNRIPLGSLLLLMAATRQEPVVESVLLEELCQQIEDESLTAKAAAINDLFQMLAQLPPDERRGANRYTLLRVLTDAIGPSDHLPGLGDMISELNNSLHDAYLFQFSTPFSKKTIEADIECLYQIRQSFSDLDQLLYQLRTGLPQPPQPAAVTSPEPSSATTPLLEDLLNDVVTAPLAHLTAALEPLLHLPRHAAGNSDQALGGIADLSNRGSYDRLLLSELAQDDIVLTARLVNNEALYYRKEQPPRSPLLRRTVLLDTTLKMWGLPKLFSLSVALAFQLQGKKNLSYETYTLSGNDFLPADLTSKAGILDLLTRLDYQLHCGEALESALDHLAEKSDNETILITEPGQLRLPEFAAALHANAQRINYLVSVDRNGIVQLFSNAGSGLKKVWQATIDIASILKNAKPALEKPLHNPNLPAFLQQRQAPLLFPNVRLPATEDRYFPIPGYGCLVINTQQRVLLIASKETGARELLSGIERGQYWIDWNGQDRCYILIYNRDRRLLKLYSLPLDPDSNVEPDIFSPFVEVGKSVTAAFTPEHLLVRSANMTWSINLHTGDGTRVEGSVSKISNNDSLIKDSLALSVYVWTHASMFKLRALDVTENRTLAIGSFLLNIFAEDNFIQVKERITVQETLVSAEFVEMRDIPSSSSKVKLRLWKWPDGSECYLDGRGLLHLRSSNKSLPEVTIVLVTGMKTSAWCSDGSVCGNPAFIPHNTHVMNCSDFYDFYINPILEHIAHSS